MQRTAFNDLNSWLSSAEVDEITMIGGIAEQVVGQLLRTIEPLYIEPNLYCWHREERGSSAEIDYVIQHGHHVILLK